MKRLMIIAAIAIIFAGGISTLHAAGKHTGGAKGTRMTLKNGLKNGAKNGMAQGQKYGLKYGLKKGLKNGLKNGQKK